MPVLLQERIFAEFNTLSVVYAQPEVEFVDEAHQFKSKAVASTPAAPVFASGPAVGAPAAYAPVATYAPAAAAEDPFFSPAPAPAAAVPAAAPAVVARGEVDLLGLDDMFGAPAPVAPPPQAAWGLNPAAVLEPTVFQSKWATLAAGCVVVFAVF